MGEPQIKRIIAGFVAQSHVILPLAGSLVAGTMFVTAVLASAPFATLQALQLD